MSNGIHKPSQLTPIAPGPTFHRSINPIIIFVLMLILTGCFDLDVKGKATADLILFGTIDIREVQLAFQDAGRIQRLNVDEGAKVRQGQVVAELDPSRFQMEAGRLAEEVAAQSHVVDRLNQGSRPQELEKARTGVVAAKANLREAELFLSRKQSLLVTNRISQQEIDSAKTRVQVLTAALKTAEEEASLAVEGPRKEDIAAAEATLAALKAAKVLAEKRLSDTRLLAPADGVIRNRILEPGSMASPGAPVLTLALNNPLWARAYVSEPDLGKVQEGMRAELHTDTYPDKIYKGWVGFISSTAEFTPKTVETTELRTKLVYRARIFACDPHQELRLGMPVTVTINTSRKNSHAEGPAHCE